MKNTKFIHTKIGSNKNKSLKNLIIIFITIIIGAGSIFSFAGLLLFSGIGNYKQVINRILISFDGTDNINSRIYDINYAGGKIKIYLDKINNSMKKDQYRGSGNDWKMIGLNMESDNDKGSDIVLIDKLFLYNMLSGLVSTGSIGITGEKGETGPQGLQGPSGEIGPQGIQGEQGAIGNTGLQGPTGSIGITGEKGETGPQGPQGPTGLAGNIGIAIDNLGNHTAGFNINIQNHFISSNGISNKGINFNNNDLYIYDDTLTDGKILAYKSIEIGNDGQSSICSQNNSGEMRFINGCFEGCDGQSRIILGKCNNTSHIGQCKGLPDNASRNTVNQIIQYGNLNSRYPSLTGTYSITGSTTECKFKCNVGYIYSGLINQCIFDSKI